MRFVIWLMRDVAYHPRGYYRLARTLAQRYEVEVWGRPMPSVALEGPLRSEVDPSIWQALCEVPKAPNLAVQYLHFLPPRPHGVLIVCDPAGLAYAALLGVRPHLWDIWEPYAANYTWDPIYTPLQRWVRRLLWAGLTPLRTWPRAFTLAEYAYAGLTPPERTFFLPNAFVPVEDLPPLLPNLRGAYALYTGNIAPAWGIQRVLQEALAKPDEPFVLAGSLKSKAMARFIAQTLQAHPRWLWVRSRFVPYPVIQNLQRYAHYLYAPYAPLPHLVGRLFGKFYEAAALNLPVIYPKGQSLIWDAFWARYRRSHSPQLYWTYYQAELWKALGQPSTLQV
ncbi:MAG: hypothetical protein ABDH91_02875 [Bacteroidia bacterium]